MKFEDYQKEFLLFLELERGYSNETIKTYNRGLNKFSSFIKKTKINYLKLNKNLILDFHESLNKSISPRTFTRILSTLRTFYRFLYREEAIDDIVLNEVKSYPSPKYSKSVPQFISKDQVSIILKNIGTDQKLSDGYKFRNQSIILLFFSSGLRLDELKSIKLRDINFSNSTISVVGKGSKKRLINFNEETKLSIIKYLTFYQKYPLLKTNFDNNLFVDEKNKILSRYNIQYIVMKNLKTIPKLSSHGPHTLRHSFATHLINSGVKLDAIKTLLGHSSISSTQIYTKVNTDTLRETLKRAHPRGKK